uniref:Lipoprotein n=1 Tax=Geobacter metallireducens TaxID=28232 RepID=A0A831UCZ5_GEOME
MKMKVVALCLMAACLAGCSLPPEKPVTKDELYATGIYNFYTIKESPESVLAAVNREGEVILDAKYRDRPVFIKILALSSGLQVHVIEK